MALERSPRSSPSRASTSAETDKPLAPAPGANVPAGQGSVPWQSVAPNPDDPIVLRAGQPMSMLPGALAGYPKGTKLERDSEGNIRAVLPAGWRGVVAPKGARPTHPGPRSGAGKDNPAPHSVKPASGKLPPGWLPDAKAVVTSLLRLPGMHSASPVWGAPLPGCHHPDRGAVAVGPRHRRGRPQWPAVFCGGAENQRPPGERGVLPRKYRPVRAGANRHGRGLRRLFLCLGSLPRRISRNC